MADLSRASALPRRIGLVAEGVAALTQCLEHTSLTDLDLRYTDSSASAFSHPHSDCLPACRLTNSTLRARPSLPASAVPASSNALGVEGVTTLANWLSLRSSLTRLCLSYAHGRR